MIHRFLDAQIREALTDTPVVLIVGARQVGKSTLAAQLTSAAATYTLDDLNTLAAATADPVGFVRNLPERALIDEVQRAPDLLLSLKASVDRDRRPGRFILTGSANVLTLPRISESLAGRLSVHHLWPLSQRELDGGKGSVVDLLFGEALPQVLPVSTAAPDITLEARVLRGGYPDVISRSERRRDAWFRAYLETVLIRDVQDLSRIAGLADLPRLLGLIAARSGNLLNVSDLARDAGLNNVTFARYLDLLRAVYLVITVPAWATNRGKRLIKAPKVYIGDSGLCAYLLGVSSAGLRRERGVFGPMLEGFVLGELGCQLGWSEVDARLYHYRTTNGQEVDAVLEGRDGRVVGVEVKASATVTSGDFSGLRALREDAGERFHRGVVLYTGEQVVPFGDRLTALPVQLLWSHLSGPTIEMLVAGR